MIWIRFGARLGDGDGGSLPVSAAPDAGVSGFAIRREWPDGSHDFFGFDRDVGRVLRRLARDARYWRRAPIRPIARTAVFISRAAFRGHRPQCWDERCVGRLAARFAVTGVEVGG